MELTAVPMLGVWLRSAARAVWQCGLIVLITLALLEALVAFSFRFPAASPIPLPLLRQMHVLFDRQIIQVTPECAQYDDRLTYTLKHGRCVFASREFSNEYLINSLGLRDDEASLDRPSAVMLGDSITMGWGVEQGEAFPSVYERLTGASTLNAGVSSYGTVRELRMLDRIDRRALTDVVIQYSSNDFSENSQLVEGRFETLSRAQYERTVIEHEAMIRYHPGKYALNALVLLRNLVRGEGAAPAQSVAREAEVFVSVIETSPVALDGLRVTVISFDRGFADSARQVAATSRLEWIRQVRFLDLSEIASHSGTFYVLDDHPTAAGHAAVARLLAAELVAEH